MLDASTQTARRRKLFLLAPDYWLLATALHFILLPSAFILYISGTQNVCPPDSTGRRPRAGSSSSASPREGKCGRSLRTVWNQPWRASTERTRASANSAASKASIARCCEAPGAATERRILLEKSLLKKSPPPSSSSTAATCSRGARRLTRVASCSLKRPRAHQCSSAGSQRERQSRRESSKLRRPASLPPRGATLRPSERGAS